MRRFLILSPLILVALALAIIAGGVTLADAHPIPSFSLLFPLQDLSDQAIVLFTFNQEAKAERELDLVELRLRDLETATGKSGEEPALISLDRALDRVLEAVAGVPEENSAVVTGKLSRLAAGMQQALVSLTLVPGQHPDMYSAFQIKVNTLLVVLGDGSLAAEDIDELFLGQARNRLQIVSQKSGTLLAQADPGLASVPTQLVPFPPGSPGALHAFFPLTGEHADLACTECHTSDQYSGMSTECADCHMVDEPSNHYPAECSACHTPVSWSAVSFNHSAINTSDCNSCHIPERPANHYNGQCSACHTTSAWMPANFNHAAAGATNCGDCHSQDKPANHYQGQCSACHDVDAWKPATFNHAAVGATDCVSCHTSDKPAGHFDGQCSACHATDKWKPASLDHSQVSTNCISCHLPSKPPNHFDGQCSTCHSTDHWKPANFDHSQVSNDCISCHLDDKPGNHFDGQCSGCHNTNAWEPANFDHSQITSNCVSCHLDDAPNQHFTSECSQCHNVNGWGSVNINHTFPVGHKDADGKCQKCHPSLTAAWTCESCHSMGDMINKHEDIPDFAGRCLECHPTGQEPDD